MYRYYSPLSYFSFQPMDRCWSVVERPLMVQWGAGSIPHGGPIVIILFQPVLNNWYNKGRDTYYRDWDGAY